MPKIADATSIQRGVPSGKQSVSSYRNQGAGQFEKDMGDLFAQIGDRRDKSSLAKAENDFLLAKAKQDNAYDEDEDYSSIESRWTENVEGSLSEAAASISNPALREEFIARQRVRVEEGRQRMEEVSRKKEYDFERADLSRRLEETVNTGIEGGDFMTAYGSASNLIDTNIALSEEQKQELRQKTKVRMATGRLEMLPPEERLGEISKLEEYLPKDTVAKYRRQAEEALVDDRAQAAVDAVMSSTGDIEERRKLINSQFKTDTKVRDEANRRLDYQNTKEKEAEVELRKNLHEEYFMQVREGSISVTDIPSAEREAMGPAMLNSLYAAQSARVSGKALTSDRQVLFDLHRMNSSNDPNVKTQMTEYFIDNADKLSNTDFNNWAKAVSKEGAPPEVKSMLTAQQTISSKIAQQNAEGSSYGKEDERVLLEGLNQWHLEYQQTHDGKVPTDSERDKKIDQLLLEFPTTGWFMGSDAMPLFQMNDSQLGAAMYQAKERNADSFSKATEFVVNVEKLDPNTKQGKRRILEAYKRLVERGEQ